MFSHRSLVFAVSTFAVVPLLVLAVSPPWERGGRHTELFVAGSTDDASLRRRIAALSPTVSPDDARRVAYAAYMTGLELRREWRVVWLPGVQNLLVNIGARKGGLCFQWATELLVRLDALKLQTLELHWAESFANTSGEHNVIVVTARGQTFERAFCSTTGVTRDSSFGHKSPWIRSITGRKTNPKSPADRGEQG